MNSLLRIWKQNIKNFFIFFNSAVVVKPIKIAVGLKREDKNDSFKDPRPRPKTEMESVIIHQFKIFNIPGTYQ